MFYVDPEAKSHGLKWQEDRLRLQTRKDFLLD